MLLCAAASAWRQGAGPDAGLQGLADTLLLEIADMGIDTWPDQQVPCPLCSGVPDVLERRPAGSCGGGRSSGQSLGKSPMAGYREYSCWCISRSFCKPGAF